MKKSVFLLFLISFLFSSCNKNDELDLEVNLPIAYSFIPVSIDINPEEMDEEQRQELSNLTNHERIINDIKDLPNDPIGQNEAFEQINFKENTLLLMYLTHRWNIDTYSNRFYRNTEDNTYNWVAILGTTADIDPEYMHLIRLAIVVKKLPAGATVKNWYSLSEIGT
ncbi:MAG: hypothetical protein J1E95_10775 [Muribaculaceae bacterium]|nr:hypothetical protein [Muribaculaceae bacterium]